jgi:hypothetical protein
LKYSVKRIYNLYSREKEEEFHDHSEVSNCLREITRLVFVIYHRIIHSKEEDPEKFESFKISDKIFKEWILDLPKLLEIY